MTERSPKHVNIQRLAQPLHTRVGMTHYTAVEFLIVLVLLLVVTPLVEG